jgi:predicted outer membrane lipoprotein
MIYCFNVRVDKTHDFTDSFANPSHSPYIYEFKYFLENRIFLIPAVTFILGLIHSVIIQTLFQKKLYYYPLSHIIGVVMRLLLVCFVSNVTGIVSIGFDFFHFILGCFMAVAFAVTVCLALYLVKKLLRCRTSKHTIFIFAMSIYCLSNTMFMYLCYILFDENSKEKSNSPIYDDDDDFRRLTTASDSGPMLNFTHEF